MSPEAQQHPVPLVVLAGSDPEPAALPPGSGDLHPLRGAKAVTVQVDKRPMIDVVLERFRSSGEFEPLFVAGPRRLLGARHKGAEVIDTDSTFGENLRAAIENVQRGHRGVMAFTTCDIVPSVEEILEVLTDYHRHRPLDFWFPVIAAPTADRLGASAWKPRYRMIPSGGSREVSILPGHLLIADPAVFRLELVYRTFQLAYETRNTGVMYRLRRILLGVVSHLAATDLVGLRRLRPPTATLSVSWNAVRLALALRGVARQEQLETRLERIFLVSSRRRRGGRIALASALSLARDIDTREEARELAGRGS